jgi:hydrogenase maturation protease
VKPPTSGRLNGRTCVVAFGQTAAGDDGVGLAILVELRRASLPKSIESIHLRDPVDLVPLLTEYARLVLIDAVIAQPVGAILDLDLEQLATQVRSPLSCHGLRVTQAIELARSLDSNLALPEIRIVAVGIERPDQSKMGLSPAVAAAIPGAAKRVLLILQGGHFPRRT